MKKLALALFFISFLTCSANNIPKNEKGIKKLEQAILKSNITTVKTILPLISISPSEQKRLFILAENVFQKRQSFLSLFVFSNENLLTVIVGLGLSATALLEVCILYTLKVPFNNYLANMLSIQFNAGILTTTIAITNHFYDFWKLYNNAIAIKSLMLKDSTQK
ncbi:hypothetical protein E3J79_03760 [Candidatus Dependentiae bacterium]|nr:MAG: hypothetical protein E3J79_03760 [Candidatus Dependentiae bacterium]